jgi:hypothetical protein
MSRRTSHGTALVAVLVTIVFAVQTEAQAGMLAIGFDFSPGTSGGIQPAQSAGAPGVRISNWNNLYGGTPTVVGGSNVFSGTLGAGSVKLSDGTTAAATTVSWSYPGWYGNGSGGTDDRAMFSGTFDPFGGTSNGLTYLTVATVPFDHYDVYFYTGFGDGFTGRGGSVTVSDGINTITRYIQTLASEPSPDVYTESTATSWAAATAGTYVHFTGLRGSTLTISTVDLGGSRFQISGMEIVQVPEPSTCILLGLGGAGLLFGIRRRRRTAQVVHCLCKPVR